MHMTLEEIFEHGQQAAQVLFAAQGEVHPMWLAQTTTGEILPIIAPMHEREDKDSLVDGIRAIFKQKDVIRYVSLLEAWMLEMKNQPLPASVRLGAPISQHPERREIIAIAAEDKTDMLTGMFYILRPEHGKAQLSPFKRMEKSTRHEGRFVGLLGDRP